MTNDTHVDNSRARKENGRNFEEERREEKRREEKRDEI
jgi:hypothetical protein